MVTQSILFLLFPPTASVSFCVFAIISVSGPLDVMSKSVLRSECDDVIIFFQHIILLFLRKFPNSAFSMQHK